MRGREKRKVAAVVVWAVVTGMIVHIWSAQAAEPGSGEDPLVSLSYVDGKLSDLKTYVENLFSAWDGKIRDVNTKVSELEKEVESLSSEKESDKKDSESSNKLQRVDLEPGERIIGMAGTEMILRMGKVNSIATEAGGLSDVTAGKDIPHGENVPSNHLVIVPVDDGRGVECVEKAIVLVRGEYKVEKVQ